MRAWTAIAAISFLIAIPGEASAKWYLFNDEDALTDEKTFTLSGDGDGFVLMMKCWTGANGEVAFGVMSNSGTFPNLDKTESARLRVDKNSVVEVDLKATDLHGSTLYGTSLIDSPQILPLFTEMGSATDRVVIGIGGQVLIFPLKGFAQPYKKWRDGCGSAITGE